jgi:hypothetical protein
MKSIALLSMSMHAIKRRDKESIQRFKAPMCRSAIAGRIALSLHDACAHAGSTGLIVSSEEFENPQNCDSKSRVVAARGLRLAPRSKRCFLDPALTTFIQNGLFALVTQSSHSRKIGAIGTGGCA